MAYISQIKLSNTTYDISAIKLKNARTLTIGNSGKSFDGTANVSWPLHDILYTSTVLGETSSWNITTPGIYAVGSSNAFSGDGNPENANGGLTPYRWGQLIVSKANTYGLAQFYVSHQDSNSSHQYGIKYRTGWNNNYVNTWETLLDSGNYNHYAPTLTGTGAYGTWGISISGNAATATKLATTRTISLTGSVTGSGTFDGSGNLSIATSTNHHHDSTYVNITGDTMTGALNFQNNILNKVGDDSAFGDQNLAGHFIIQGLNGTTALGFKEYGATNIASVYSNGTKIWTGANALLPCWSTLTGGNANVAGWRLIGSHALGTWHNNRANFIINSRHTGNGLLSIAYGCNAGEVTQSTVYCDVVISGNNSGSGAIWNNNAFKCYYNSANNYLYFFWYYTDYNSTDIISFGSPISDFYPQDGTWVETIDAATYGVEITTLRKSWNSGDSVTGAVWNDYAECRESNSNEPGYVLIENGDDTLSKSTERLQQFAGISSDTWGFSQGETDKAKTHIAVAGRVLAYTYKDRNEYKPGDAVCTAPGGTVDIMTEEEIIKYPHRIVGTVSCVPNYEEWGGGQDADRPPVKVNGRIWIKVK